MSSATETLVKTLEENVNGPLHYAESIATLTGDYKLLNDEIERYLQLDSLKEQKAIQGNITTAAYNAGKGILAEAREDASWYEKLAGSDNRFIQKLGTGVSNLVNSDPWENVAWLTLTGPTGLFLQK